MATDASPEKVTLTVPRGSDITIRGTLGSTVSGHTYAFYIGIPGCTPIITKTPAVITEATGVMDVTIADTDIDTELSAGRNYEWSWWRIDAGNQRLVGWGPWVSERGKPT
jgi:hypothetical protein